MEWKYRMYINGVYWKGYGAEPTVQQRDIEVHSFKNSQYYFDGEVEVTIDKME